MKTVSLSKPIVVVTNFIQNHQKQATWFVVKAKVGNDDKLTSMFICASAESDITPGEYEKKTEDGKLVYYKNKSKENPVLISALIFLTPKLSSDDDEDDVDEEEIFDDNLQSYDDVEGGESSEQATELSGK
ncbi:MAG: hypothetical protein QG566_10 [Patescibacteria group bacterium]|nr:hypothetical protein [Patescibacteria group bacterium]